ncbi:hypothetical protein BDA99DRAFT_223765 [Phascolomyces articulosus]|uniref:CUE domain-containing protein n=1 Tax=Phascolomyces articulosus TaxID=60185 RepID=A0AAD5P9F0_9FUNG|nr:hypothetical protein BDA99DRAFT_223765 [Phascolomyces articulosus]
MNSSLSGSISTFLRKASISNSVTLPRRAAFSGETPKPSLSRLFLPTSMSRLSLTRSPRPKVMPFTDDFKSSQQYNSPCQQPKSAKPPKRQTLKPPRPFIVDSTTSLSSTTRPTDNTTSRWRGSIRISTSSRRTSTESLPSISSPLSASSKLSRTLKKASCETMLPSNERLVIPTYQPSVPSPLATKTITSTLPPPRTIKPMDQGPDAALNELCSVLPQLDRQIVQEYLNESGGDPMVAITLAMSQYKKMPTTTARNDSNSISVKKQSSSPSMYKQRQRVK